MAVRKIASATRVVRDSFSPEYFTRIEFLIPRPEYDADLPCILVAIRNGHRKLFFGFANIEALAAVFRLTGQERKRLADALREAQAQAAEIIEEERLLGLRR